MASSELFMRDLLGRTWKGNARELRSHLEQAERVHIRRALERSGKSVSRTAELLGISCKTLWEKMKRLGISA